MESLKNRRWTIPSKKFSSLGLLVKVIFFKFVHVKFNDLPEKSYEAV